MARKWNLEQLTEENLKEQIEKAREAGENADVIEPRAESVHYDRLDNRITIWLKNGAVSSFPPTLVQGLADATPEEIADFFVTPGGRSIRWESLDIDFSIPGLVAHIFGTREWIAELGRQGGQRTSTAKAEAARRNGAIRRASEEVRPSTKIETAKNVLESGKTILDATQQILEGSSQQNPPKD